MEKKNKRIEELDSEGWISDLAFFVHVAGHLNTLNKELQGKDKLITEMFDSIKAFKVKLRLWENQLKLHNLVPHLKSLEIISSEHIQEYSRRNFSDTRGARRTIPGLQNYGTGIYVVCSSFEGRH
jgi:hypothetical protein